MSNCLNCKKEIEAHTGRRPKKFCSDACRQAYHNSQKSRNYVTKATYEAVLEENKALKAELAILSQNKPIEGNVSKTKESGRNVAQNKSDVKIQDLTNQPKTNYSIDTTKHRLWKEDDPRENTIAFARKYNNAWNYDELEKQFKSE